MIIDYSTARPSMSLLRQEGVTAVGRYIGWDSVPGYSTIHKNITLDESRVILSAGISIFLAFEYSANAAASGNSQGMSDGALATSQLHQLGAPADMAVYFAIDFDVPDYAPKLADTPVNANAKLGPIAHYFAAVKSRKPTYEIGAYGSYWVIKRLFDAGLITKGWQTVAWSGGHLDSRVNIYQTVQGLPSGIQNIGADPDIREHFSTEPDFGQWPRPSAQKLASVPKGTIVSYPIVLDAPSGVAYVLPVPPGMSKVIIYADPMGSAGPVIRLGFGPSWSKVEVKPTWDDPSVTSLPTGESRVSLSRIDTGIVPVTIDFA